MYKRCVPTDDRAARPPLAKSAEGPLGAFGALLSSAVADPATARGLALAYASLEVRQRLQIIDAVVHDARAEGIGASAVLASLFALEDDVAVARRIAEAMSIAGDEGLKSEARLRAWLAGDLACGGAILVRPLHGAFVEVLGIAWDEVGGLSHTIFEPLAHHERAREHASALPTHLRFEEMPVQFAIDIMTAALWNHRRVRGELPDAVEHFADLLWIERAPE
jgi:hypothetical protein